MTEDKRKLDKIAIVGCGAVGSFYGGKLCQAGRDVHFLLRSDYEAVRDNGVHIQSPNGDFHVRPVAAKSPWEIGRCDLVVVGLKSTANQRLSELLAPLVGEGTVLLTLQNGLGNEAALAKRFPPQSVFGGMCFVCLNRIAPGVVQHLAHGKIVLGRHGGSPDELTGAIAELVRSTGIPVDVSPDLEKAHWEKLVWNIPFNGLGVAGAAGLDATLVGRLGPCQHIGPCLATDALLDNGPWEQLVTELMDEVIACGCALGHDLSPALGKHQRNRTRVMKAYLSSTLIDFERGLPLELNALFRLPLGRAKASGVETPRLAALCNLLTELDNRRKNSGSDAA